MCFCLFAFSSLVTVWFHILSEVITEISEAQFKTFELALKVPNDSDAARVLAINCLGGILHQ